MHKTQIHKISAGITGKVFKRLSSGNYKICLCYHGVQKEHNPSCIDSDVFKEQMMHLSESYRTVSLDYFVKHLRDPQENYVTVTFDDGYLNLFDFALPVLADLGIPATIFLPINYIGGKNDWYPGPKDFKLPILNLDQIRYILETYKNFSFGSHTFSHSNLSELSDNSLSHEIVDSKHNLENLLNRQIYSIAFPYGSLVEIDERALLNAEAAGYSCALTTHFGRYNTPDDQFKIRRIVIWSSDDLVSFSRKLTGQYDWVAYKEKLSRHLNLLRRTHKWK